MSPSDVIARAARWLSPEPAFQAPQHDREKVSDLVRAGRDYVRAARATDPRRTAATAALYRDALDCLLSAQTVSTATTGPEEAPGPVDAATFVSTSPLAPGDPGKDAVQLLKEPRAIPAITLRRATRALATLDRVAAGLVSKLYPATEIEARHLRMRRRVGTGLLLALSVALGVRSLTAPRNVARGKKVTASSVRFGSPQALVNGAIEWGTFGLHTGAGSEWAVIDLGTFYSLVSADIYARGDGRLEFNLPLRVDLSDDGVTFRPAGACKELFTQATPCVVNLGHQRARYVRVAASEVVLSEVEVYGEP
ncbi:MAG: discoidin domain-containing protein [Polyangiaceae bacterium]|jgi:hypothetical protein